VSLPKNPCDGCTERRSGCHSHCQIGIAYSKRVKAGKEAVKARKSYEGMIDNFKIEQIVKTKQRVGMK